MPINPPFVIANAPNLQYLYGREPYMNYINFTQIEQGRMPCEATKFAYFAIFCILGAGNPKSGPIIVKFDTTEGHSVVPNFTLIPSTSRPCRAKNSKYVVQASGLGLGLEEV